MAILGSIMPLYGHVYLISICKLDVICINFDSRHVIVTEKDYLTQLTNVS